MTREKRVFSTKRAVSGVAMPAGDADDDSEGFETAADMTDSHADGSIRLVPQAEQLKNPDAAIHLSVASNLPLLREHGATWQGLVTTDDNRYVARFWEFVERGYVWEWQQSPVGSTACYTARSCVLRWENGKGALCKASNAHNFPGSRMMGRTGVAVRRMRPHYATIHEGVFFHDHVAPIIPNDEANLPALWCFCASQEYASAVAKVDQQMKAAVASFVKVPFDLAHWQKVAAQEYPNGLPEPQSDDPTQWLFHGHVAKAEAATILQVAVARLAGYRWPAELDETMHLASEARAWVKKCKNLDQFADDDGVVPIVPMRGEPAAEGRVRDLLLAAFGGEWSSAKEATLLAAANADKAPADNLDDWLKNRFFAEHCALFHNRPFVWHIWDGRKKDGFGVLVHYHRLTAPNGEGRRLLEKITHGYLGDWVARQRDEMKTNKPGADARLAAALDLQKKLEAILAGEPPFDIFVRWKPLHEQPIGWAPDINDGVRMNIRPFIEAGVLRDKVNVKWTKDRGQEPQALRPKVDFPWFWNGSTFSGDRVNDVHLSVTEKQKAREAKGKA